MRGSFAEYAKNNSIQVTFYYDYGHSESFAIQSDAVTFGQQFNQLLAQPFLTFHLNDQTVVICMSRVIKVEVKPALPELQGEGIFTNAQRITTMQRAATGRVPLGE